MLQVDDFCEQSQVLGEKQEEAPSKKKQGEVLREQRQVLYAQLKEEASRKAPEQLADEAVKLARDLIRKKTNVSYICPKKACMKLKSFLLPEGPARERFESTLKSDNIKVEIKEVVLKEVVLKERSDENYLIITLRWVTPNEPAKVTAEKAEQIILDRIREQIAKKNWSLVQFGEITLKQEFQVLSFPQSAQTILRKKLKEKGISSVEFTENYPHVAVKVIL